LFLAAAAAEHISFAAMGTPQATARSGRWAAVLGAVLVFAAAIFAGCEKQREQAESAVRSATQAASQAASQAAAAAQRRPDQEQMALLFGQLWKAIQERQMEKLRQLSADPNCRDYTEIMSCYCDVLAIEEQQGNDAARARIAEELARGDSPPARRKAVMLLDRYFQQKGDLRSKQVVAMVLIMAMKAKYGSVGEVAAGLAIQEMGIELPKSEHGGDWDD
jgi:hypothetical protein